MRSTFFLILAFLSMNCCASSLAPISEKSAQLDKNEMDITNGLWTLQIRNLQQQVITTMSVQFTNDTADSCISGKWKRIYVKNHQTLDNRFFPTADPLSYQIEKDVLSIGRNEICDAYLHLTGKLNGSILTGEYLSFGLEHSNLEGYFSLIRITK